RGFEAARLQVGFTGLDRTTFAAERSPLDLLSAIEARQGEHQRAWQHWEADLGRGVFDDLDARRHRPLTADERHRQETLLGQLNRLDNRIAALVGAQDLSGDRRKLLDDLKGQRQDMQSQLVQFEAELVRKYQAAAGAVYGLSRIQAQLPEDAALV